MAGERYRAVDRHAYAVRPRVGFSGQSVFVVVWMSFWVIGAPTWWKLFALFPVVVYLGRPLLNFLPRASPVVVDRPGIWLDDRLVHWEMISAVVVFDGRTPDSLRLHKGVALRLRDHPDVVARRRVLDGWRLDRGRLEAAVARFGNGVPVVDGPGDLADVHAPHNSPDAMITAFREAAAEARADAPGVTVSPQAEPLRRGPERYRPEDPRAYLARLTWTSAHPIVYLLAVAGPVFAWFVTPSHWVIGPLFGAFFEVALIVHAIGVRRGVVRFAADAPGCYLGPAGAHELSQENVLLPWQGIRTVVVFDVLDQKGAGGTPAIGLTTTPDGEISHYRQLIGCRLDRPALDAAVRTFAPGVPVLTGPPVSVTHLGPVARAARQRYRPRDPGPGPGHGPGYGPGRGGT